MFDLIRYLAQQLSALICDGILAVQRFVDVAVDLCQLLAREQLMLVDQTSSDSEILLDGYVVTAQVMAIAYASAVKIPLPG